MAVSSDLLALLVASLLVLLPLRLMPFLLFVSTALRVRESCMHLRAPPTTSASQLAQARSRLNLFERITECSNCSISSGGG